MRPRAGDAPSARPFFAAAAFFAGAAPRWKTSFVSVDSASTYAHSPARPPLTSVAFPDKIGCGLAGGRWSDYLHEIEEFKRRNPLVRVIVIEYSE